MTLEILPKLKIHYLSIILLVLYGFSGFLNVYLMIFISIILHEAGHIFWVILFKGKVDEILFTPIGGVIKIQLNNKNNKLKNLLIDMGRNYYKYSYNFVS